MADLPVSAPATVAPTSNGSTTESVATPEPKGLIQAAEPLLKVTVGGKVKEMTQTQLDKLVAEAEGKRSFADKSTREAREQLKKIMELNAQLEERAKSLETEADPEKFFKKHNISEEEHARKVIQRKIAESQMSQEQKENARLKAENTQLAAEREARAKKQQETELQTRTKTYQDAMVKDLSAAAKAAGIAPNVENMNALIDAAVEHGELGLEWDATSIVDYAMEKQESAFESLRNQVAGGLTGADLAKKLGPKVTQAILDYAVQRTRANSSVGSSVKPVELKTVERKAPAPTNSLSAKEFKNKYGV